MWDAEAPQTLCPRPKTGNTALPLAEHHKSNLPRLLSRFMDKVSVGLGNELRIAVTRPTPTILGQADHPGAAELQRRWGGASQTLRSPLPCLSTCETRLAKTQRLRGGSAAGLTLHRLSCHGWSLSKVRAAAVSCRRHASAGGSCQGRFSCRHFQVHHCEHNRTPTETETY